MNIHLLLFFMLMITSRLAVFAKIWYNMTKEKYYAIFTRFRME